MSGAGRWLPLCGVAFVALIVVTLVVVAGDTPDKDASAATVASFYQQHESSARATAYLMAASAPLLVLFGVNLALALWSEEGGRPGLWPIVLVAGTAIGATSLLVMAHGALAVADGADHLTADTLQGLNTLDSGTWLVLSSALGIVLLGAAGALIAQGARILGWAALVLGIALFIPFADFVAMLLTGIWIIATSIVQFRGPATRLRPPADRALRGRQSTVDTPQVDL